ncbi:Bug family tripartite tricarboxylate transporter substrate binding protein [Mangrovicoccus algicola]|uniref:Tricarboxylate transporter n=1 Tax=Mangrovicoccus algicola TaxID=2771008 RepID=A0A8J6YVB7_9RHOB|nr:tricarboxylate transporter [Mangrovicoccus algicola]MBE3636743.1 tricarboxylate transporter [Mangrovicoccus algicola]
MTTGISRRGALGLAAMAPLVLMAGPGAADDFSGGKIDWLVPFSPGGGSGTIAQFEAPILTKYLPGNPVISLTYEPGGGSIKGANLFALRAKPTGREWLITSASTQFPYLLQDPRVKYEYQDWRIVSAAPTGGIVFVRPESGVTGPGDIAKLEGSKLTYGSQGATSLDLVPLLGFRLLGLDVQHVFGFKARADARLAFERGEITIDYQTTSAYIQNVQPLVDAGEAVPIFTWGMMDGEGNLVRDPNYPDLPHFGEVYEMLHGEPPAGPEFDAYMAFFTAGFPAQKMIFVPRDTPDEVVDTLVAGFEAMKDDPDYQANRADVLGNYDQVNGRAAEALFRKGTTISEEHRKAVVSLLAEEYGVRLGE